MVPLGETETAPSGGKAVELGRRQIASTDDKVYKLQRMKSI